MAYAVFISPLYAQEMSRLETDEVVVLCEPSLRPSAEASIAWYSQIKPYLESIFLWQIDFRPIIILIGERAAFQRMAGHRSYVAYVIPDKQLIVIDDSRMNEEAFSREATLKHELCHLVLHRYISPENLPKWLDEGISQWVSDGMADIVYQRTSSLLTQAAMSNSLLSMESISSSFPQDDKRLELAYEQSKSLIDYIINTYGKNGILNILEALRKGSDINNAVQVSLMLSVEELEQRWQKDQQGLPALLSFFSIHLYTLLFVLAALLTLVLYIRLLVRKRSLMEEEEDLHDNDDQFPPQRVE